MLAKTNWTAMTLVSLAFMTAQSRAQYPVYEIVDSTPGHEWSGGCSNPDDLINPNPAALAGIFDHQSRTGHFTVTLLENGTGIRWDFDFSNLEVHSHIFDVSNTDSNLGPLTMARLCNIGGFDHFNFVQKITELPDDTLPLVSTEDGFESIELPILDPIPDPIYSYFVYSDRANRELRIGTPNFTPDPFPFALNETPGDDLYYGHYTFARRIGFADHPRMPESCYTPPHEGDFMGFTTQLVGVYADHTYDNNSTWLGVGTVMNWRSNVRFDSSNSESGTIVFTASPDPSAVPPPTGGSIFAVHTDTHCEADFNYDQNVDFFDYLDFVDAFSAQSFDADFNHDDSVDFFDYLDFVDVFSTGC
jgi:hypothetical protein